jgi:predicted nucleotidyltransferase
MREAAGGRREAPGRGWPGRADPRFATPAEHAAARELVRRVRERIPAELWRAFVFGSKARGEGRPDSDVDVLLVFRRLPPDREPQAGMAEELADALAEETGIPVTVWSVARVDLERGNRTPMLVDALNDGIPLWPMGAPPPRLGFTPDDALRCVGALLQRVREGGEEVAELLEAGDGAAAARRARDDLVRLCIAGFLLRGETRPRRSEAVDRFVQRFVRPGRLPPRVRAVFRWAADSYGPEGRDEEGPVPPPPGGIAAVAGVVDTLREWVRRGAATLERRLVPGGTRSPAGR